MGRICFLIGHGITEDGRYNPGAVNGNYHEFKIAREIGRYAREYYNNNYSEKADLMNYEGNLTLEQRIRKCQDDTYDFIAELHLNAGGGTGVECYYKNGNAKGREYADAICDNIAAALGIPQRKNWTDEDGGDKVKLAADGSDYFGIIRRTKPTAVLIETVFIDTKADLDKVKTAAGQKKCGEAIAKAVASVRGLKKKATTDANKTTATTAKKELYRVRKSWKNAASQTGAFSALENAIAQAKANRLNVYDSEGKEVYTYKAPEAKAKFAKGDKVKVKKAVTYDGKSFVAYYNTYTVLDVEGDRVVIGIGNTVTAALKDTNLIKVTGKAVAEGCRVKVRKGARDYNGSSVAAFVYNNVYRVDELDGNRAVLDAKGICTPFHVDNLIVQ